MLCNFWYFFKAGIRGSFPRKKYALCVICLEIRECLMKCLSDLAVAIFINAVIAAGVFAQETPTPSPTSTLAPPLAPVLAPAEVTAAAIPTGQGTLLRGSAIKKFDAGEHLSSEEYRSLEAGCVGFESHHVFFQDLSTITVVYQDSPAYNAGIRVGDQIVAPEKVEDAKFIADPTLSRQKVKCGKAGTPVDVTVLRDGEPVKLTLIRMNIEDIQEPEYRRNWEQILRRLGYPQEGDFSGKSLKDLTPTE
jgi:hypothetical protein